MKQQRPVRVFDPVTSALPQHWLSAPTMLPGMVIHSAITKRWFNACWLSVVDVDFMLGQRRIDDGPTRNQHYVVFDFIVSQTNKRRSANVDLVNEMKWIGF